MPLFFTLSNIKQHKKNKDATYMTYKTCIYTLYSQLFLHNLSLSIFSYLFFRDSIF